MATICNRGLLWIAKKMNDIDSSANMTRMMVGTGTGADAASDTSLNTKTAANGFLWATATISSVGSYPTTHITQWTHTWTATGTMAITEVAIFNSSWWMLLRHLFSAAKNVISTETLTITIQMTHTGV